MQNLFHFQVNIPGDLILCEHTTGGQEAHIRFQFVQRFAQGAANSWDVGQLFWRQIIEIFVRGFTWVNFIFDAIKTGHQQSCKT